MIEKKLWGTSEEISNNFYKICIEKNGFSSMHCHEKKYNLFYIESGYLTIKFQDKPEIILCPGQKLTIEPGVYHRFFANTPVEAYELYWETPDTSSKSDIIRLDEGGIR